jgi:predicted nucleotidyltransferase
MEYQRAKEIAERKAELIKPGCARLEIVGSVKRGDKTEVHDIEILVIADTRTPRPEFGQDPRSLPKTMLDKVLNDLCTASELKFIKGGDRLRQYAIPEANTINPFCLEIYIVRPETWGTQNVIRTGPSLFSHRFVTNKTVSFFHAETNRRYNGFLPNEYQYIRGETQIKRGDQVLSLPEERDALGILGMGWIEPRDRARVAKWRG